MTRCPRCGRPEPTDDTVLHGDGCECGLCVATCWLALGDRDGCDAARDQLLAAALCFPAGFIEEVAEVLRIGAARHGCEPWESGGGQTRTDHTTHAFKHVARSLTVPSADPDTGESDLVHAIARLAIARGMELDGGGSG